MTTTNTAPDNFDNNYLAPTFGRTPSLPYEKYLRMEAHYG